MVKSCANIVTNEHFSSEAKINGIYFVHLSLIRKFAPDNTGNKMEDNKEQTTMVQEPLLTGVYGTSSHTHDRALRSSNTPCVYTDEEFKTVLHDAECGKFVTDDIVRKMFAS